MQGPPPRNFLPMTALLFAAATHGAFLVEQVTPLALLAFALCQAVALPFWGALSDRVGRRKVIIYSLVATLATAVAGYSRLALPQQFVFSVLNGLVTAGLPLAVAFTFESRDKRPENSSRGAIACAFFGGTVLMLGFNSPAVTLLLVTVALVLSALFLPDSSAASSLIGMNAMHGLWHGFAESNRTPFARWWKAFIACLAMVCGLLVTSLVVVSSNEGVPSRFVLFGCAMAACPLIARLVPDGRAPGRTVVFGVGAAALVVGAVLLSGSGSAAPQLGVAALCGAVTGSGLTVGILRFGASARKRSAGAELGAVSSIWMVFFLGGALLALGPFETSLQPRFVVAAALSLLALFVAAAATRRTA